MKKRTIWTISVVMGICFAALLYLQVRYFEQVLELRKQQFDSSVQRSLSQVAQKLEMEETLKGVKEDLKGNEPMADKEQDLDNDYDVIKKPNLYEFEQKDSIPAKIKSRLIHPSHLPKGLILRYQSGTSINDISSTMRENLKSRYLHQRVLLDKVIYSILYNSSERPIEDNLNFKMLDLYLKAELTNNGIDIPYHFTVKKRSGEEIYRCRDYETKGEEYVFRQILMPNNPPQNTGILSIHFPEMQSYIFKSVKFLLPSIIFTIVLLITFIFTIYVIFRQKRLSEIKNDFINNMTHELKTPVSSISLAVQMLIDPAMPKSEASTARLSNIINDETKRLRMLIEKVLQTSIFEGEKVSYKNKEIEANKLITDVVNTFELKVRQLGGKLDTDLQATESMIYADQMHITNVLFNLMDNAVKYRREDVDFHLKVSTWNEHQQLFISIEDNGMGIKKENLKKVFEKFYRVHTGNRHDVKGFGLGLAYVKGIIEAMHGKIQAESEFGKGTRFIISLPTIEE